MMEYVFCCIYYRILERIGRNELIKDYLLLVGFDLVKNKFYCTYYKSSGGFLFKFSSTWLTKICFIPQISYPCVFLSCHVIQFVDFCTFQSRINA